MIRKMRCLYTFFTFFGVLTYFLGATV